MNRYAGQKSKLWRHTAAGSSGRWCADRRQGPLGVSRKECRQG